MSASGTCQGLGPDGFGPKVLVSESDDGLRLLLGHSSSPCPLAAAGATRLFCSSGWFKKGAGRGVQLRVVTVTFCRRLAENDGFGFLKFVFFNGDLLLALDLE